MTDERQSESEEQEESKEQGESEEQGEGAAQERRELEAQVGRLIEQIERLQESSRVSRTRLEGREKRIESMLSDLRPLEGKVAGLTLEEFSRARKTLEEAIVCYQGLVNDAPLAGWHAYLFFFALVATPFLLAGVLALNYMYKREYPEFGALYTVVYCICGGGLGGAAGALRDLIYFTGKRLYDPAWGRSYLLRPLLGAIMGVAAYALLQAGLLIASQGTGVRSSNVAYFAVAFVGGFAVEQMAKKLYDIAETTFAVSERRTRGT